MTDYKQQYITYIKSQQWGIKRDEALKHYDYTCQHCYRKTNLHVHHKSYTNLGNETMEDLTVLCTSCHRKEHKLLSMVKAVKYCYRFKNKKK